MAFSTQKNFLTFNFPTIRKKSENQMKTYESCTDTRAWCMDNMKRAKYLAEVVQKMKQLPLSGSGDGSQYFSENELEQFSKAGLVKHILELYKNVQSKNNELKATENLLKDASKKFESIDQVIRENKELRDKINVSKEKIAQLEMLNNYKTQDKLSHELLEKVDMIQDLRTENKSLKSQLGATRPSIDEVSQLRKRSQILDMFMKERNNLTEKMKKMEMVEHAIIRLKKKALIADQLAEENQNICKILKIMKDKSQRDACEGDLVAQNRFMKDRLDEVRNLMKEIAFYKTENAELHKQITVLYKKIDNARILETELDKFKELLRRRDTEVNDCETIIHKCIIKIDRQDHKIKTSTKRIQDLCKIQKSLEKICGGIETTNGVQYKDHPLETLLDAESNLHLNLVSQEEIGSVKHHLSDDASRISINKLHRSLEVVTIQSRELIESPVKEFNIGSEPDICENYRHDNQILKEQFELCKQQKNDIEKSLTEHNTEFFLTQDKNLKLENEIKVCKQIMTHLEGQLKKQTFSVDQKAIANNLQDSQDDNVSELFDLEKEETKKTLISFQHENENLHKENNDLRDNFEKHVQDSYEESKALKAELEKVLAEKFNLIDELKNQTFSVNQKDKAKNFQDSQDDNVSEFFQSEKEETPERLIGLQHKNENLNKEKNDLRLQFEKPVQDSYEELKALKAELEKVLSEKCNLIDELHQLQQENEKLQKQIEDMGSIKEERNNQVFLKCESKDLEDKLHCLTSQMKNNISVSSEKSASITELASIIDILQPNLTHSKVDIPESLLEMQSEIDIHQKASTDKTSSLTMGKLMDNVDEVSQQKSNEESLATNNSKKCSSERNVSRFEDENYKIDNKKLIDKEAYRNSYEKEVLLINKRFDTKINELQELHDFEKRQLYKKHDTELNTMRLQLEILQNELRKTDERCHCQLKDPQSVYNNDKRLVKICRDVQEFGLEPCAMTDLLYFKEKADKVIIDKKNKLDERNNRVSDLFGECASNLAVTQDYLKNLKRLVDDEIPVKIPAKIPFTKKVTPDMSSFPIFKQPHLSKGKKARQSSMKNTKSLKSKNKTGETEYPLKITNVLHHHGNKSMKIFDRSQI